MRFSETLRFNANPEWWLYYIPYDELKEHVERLRKKYARNAYSRAPVGTDAGEDSSDYEDDDEREAPMPSDRPSMNRSASRSVLAAMNSREGQPIEYGSSPKRIQSEPNSAKDSLQWLESLSLEDDDALFFDYLDKHSQNIDGFYRKLCSQLRANTGSMEELAKRLVEKRRSTALHESEVERTPLLSVITGAAHERRQTNEEAKMRKLRRDLCAHYHELGDTVNFSHLNRTGFEKILKKHDKYVQKDSRAAFMSTLLRETTFADTNALQKMKAETEKLYGDVFLNGDTQMAKQELRKELRDLIVWDRNTIWRDVLRTQRKTTPFRIVKGGEKLEAISNTGVEFRPRMLPTLLAVAAFLSILMFPSLTHGLPVQGSEEYTTASLNAAHRCLAMVACVVILWASDGVPLFVTSFLVLPACVLLRVFLDENGKPLAAHDASVAVFKNLSSPTLILIICVYALGAALSKFDIDKLVATTILSKIQRPTVLLGSVMFLAVFVSMFVSNVAAPVLLNSVIMPTIDALGDSDFNRKYVRCLLLGIMTASNIGGFASPISSPQSAVALGLLVGEYRISFVQWLMAAIPLCIVMVFVCFLTLCMFYSPNNYTLPPLPSSSERFRWPHYAITASLVVTVTLWADHALSDVFGSAGIVAVIPVLVLFGAGILSKEDFNNLPWDVVYLVAGGSVLGAAVESCKLLDLVAGRLTHTIGTSNLLLTYVIFCVFMALVANAVSHTVSAIIVLPLIYTIGTVLGHPQLLVLGGTFAASSAMALPISSFPNISATQVEDEKGESYLTPKEVLQVGSLMTTLCTAVLLIFGYKLMLVLDM